MGRISIKTDNENDKIFWQWPQISVMKDQGLPPPYKYMYIVLSRPVYPIKWKKKEKKSVSQIFVQICLHIGQFITFDLGFNLQPKQTV